MALENIFNVDKRHISKARKKWWKYRIAFEFKINPQLIEEWQAEEILEALAAIAMTQAKQQTTVEN